MERDELLLKALGDEIRHLRKKKRLSQEALALDAKINRSYLAKIETSQFHPTLNVVHHIANALETTLPNLVDAVWQRYLTQAIGPATSGLIDDASSPNR